MNIKRVVGTAVLSAAVAILCMGGAACPLGASVSGVDQAMATTSTSKKAPKPSKKQLKAFKKASAKFSLKLFQKSVAKNGKKNTVVAPMSVLTALALASNGSAGKTRTELQNVLAGGEKVKRLDKNMRWFNEQLTNSKGAKLQTANAIWYNGDGTLKLKSAFKKANRTYFDALVEPVDFTDPTTVDHLNAWISKKTKKLIPKAFDELDPNTQTVLANTLYFNAKWAKPYDPDTTVKKNFTNAKGAKHKVDMMGATENGYISAKGVKGFVKPYVKGYSFVALLPKKGTSLKSFAKKLTGSKFTKLVNGVKDERVITVVPKLDVSYSDDHMGKVLKKLGIKRALNPDKADFSKMGTPLYGKLYLDEVIHKTRLKLDEDGTEAAAVTAAMVKASSMPFPTAKPKKVTLNRPFVFAIIDNTTKLPLFVGAINDVQ